MINKSKTEINQLNDGRFSLLAFATNRNLLSHMRRIALDFDMNFETTFVFCTLSHLNLSHGFHPNLPSSKVLDREDRNQFRQVRLRDVVGVTSLPRETVRRKLLQLQSEGKVLQPEEGYWCIDMSSVYERMIELTKTSIRNLIKTTIEIK